MARNFFRATIQFLQSDNETEYVMHSHINIIKVLASNNASLPRIHHNKIPSPNANMATLPP